MSEEFLFVSCDVVAHSSGRDLTAQVEQARGINEIVRQTLVKAGPSSCWFSGGDGGHVALVGSDAPALAIALLFRLREWSVQQKVLLRIVGCSGFGERFEGADGRTDMVGPGLTLAARLLQYAASEHRIVVTEQFRRRCETALTETMQVHDRRELRGRFAEPQVVWLLSAANHVSSKWELFRPSADTINEDEHAKLKSALAHNDGLSVLYWSKRLMQVNPMDAAALSAIRDQMRGGVAGRISSSSMVAQLFADPSLGQEFVRATVLVERAAGDLLVRAKDEGRTMFLVLRGRLAGILPANENKAEATPDFTLGPGDLVGEMAFALRAKRTATLICIDDTALLAIGQDELFVAIGASPVHEQVKNTVDAIVRARMVENMCKTVPYLSGAQRTGPLGEIERPWHDLVPYCRTIHAAWQRVEIRFDAAEFRDEGVYLLVGGKLQTSDGALVGPDELEPPIVVAKLPGGIDHRLTPCHILDDVTILFIGNKGVEQFGSTVHRRFAGEIRSRTGRVEKSRPVAGPVEGLLRIGGGVDRAGGIDVIFVHGLDGDARTTWHPKDAPNAFWPAWLAEDVSDATVWSLGYAVDSSAWMGSDMPLADRASNALAKLDAAGIGDRPIVFVCHSLGGLLVKQMLRHASDYGVASWTGIARNTRGIVFLSTPHSGSDISSWLKYIGLVLRLNTSVKELEAHDPRLRELNTWFRNSPLVASIAIEVYCEKHSVAGVLVVNETSADPGLKGVVPIPLDESHVSICKMESREKLVYSRVKRLIAGIVSAGV